MSRLVKVYQDLDVYKLAMDGAMLIFEMTRTFPPEEKYSLTDQVRRSSRSVSANICEAWRKRRYKLSFVSKLNDAETEAAETKVWIEFAYRCKYIDKMDFENIENHYDHIIGKLVKMISHPDRWLLKEIGSREKRKREHK